MTPSRSADNATERAHCEPAQLDQPQTPGVEPVEREQVGMLRSARQQPGDQLAVEPPQHVRQHGGRGRVEPLHVVDRDEQTAARSENAKGTEDRRSDHARVEWAVRAAPRAGA